MSKHTPGPWRHEFETKTRYDSFTGVPSHERNDWIHAGKDTTVALACTKATAEADAARIVACVNACEGIEDPADLRKQRDELLERSKNFMNFVLESVEMRDAERARVRECGFTQYLRHVIAKAEGRKP